MIKNYQIHLLWVYLLLTRQEHDTNGLYVLCVGVDFFGALRARVYDDEVRNWISGVGVNSIGKKLVNSKEGPPTFEQPKMTLEKLLEYGNMLVQEQENVKRVQLADKYLSEAALGEANEDSINRGSFYG